MGKVEHMLSPNTSLRSYLFCTELMSAMDTVEQACMVCSGIENKGQSLKQTLWFPGPLGGIYQLPTVVYLIFQVM